MKLIPLLISFTLFCPTLTGQSVKSRLSATDLAGCQIDSVTVQSLVSNTVTKVGMGDPVDIVDPTDLVLFIFDRPDEAPIIKGPVFVEGETITLAKQGTDCSKITVESAAQSRLEAYETFVNTSPPVSDEQILEKIEANLHSIFVHKYLNYYTDKGMENARISKKIIRLFTESESALRESLLVKPYLARIQLTVNDQIFRLADFDFIPHSGNQTESAVSPSFYLYDFWYTRCSPCLKDHKIMKKDLRKQRLPKEVQLISICSNASTVEDWRKYLSRHDLPWDNYHVSNSGVEIVETYGIIAFPTYILTDAKGNILKYTTRYAEVSEEIEKLK